MKNRYALIVGLLLGVWGLASRAEPPQWSKEQISKKVEDFSEGRSKLTFKSAKEKRLFLKEVRALQASTPDTKLLAMYLAYTLAYFHIDYARNVQRLERPILASESRETQKKYIEIIDELEEPLSYLQKLARRYHDAVITKTLLSHSLDGAPGEIQWDLAIESLRDDTPLVMRIAQSSPEAREIVATALSFEDTKSYRRFRSRIQRYSAQSPQAVRNFAQKFLKEVEKERRGVERPLLYSLRLDSTSHRLGLITSQEAKILAAPKQTGRVVSSVWRDTYIAIVGKKGDYYTLRMADGTDGYVLQKEVVLVKEVILVPSTVTRPNRH